MVENDEQPWSGELNAIEEAGIANSSSVSFDINSWCRSTPLKSLQNWVVLFTLQTRHWSRESINTHWRMCYLFVRLRWDQLWKVYKTEIPYLVVPKHVGAKELAGFHNRVKTIPEGVSFKDDCNDFCFFQFFKNSRETMEEINALYDEAGKPAVELTIVLKFKFPSYQIKECI